MAGIFGNALRQWGRVRPERDSFAATPHSFYPGITPCLLALSRFPHECVGYPDRLLKTKTFAVRFFFHGYILHLIISRYTSIRANDQLPSARKMAVTVSKTARSVPMPKAETLIRAVRIASTP